MTMWAVGDVKPADYNPRSMRPSAFAKLKDSLERFGMVDPLVVNANTGTLVGGHQRLRAAMELGWENVPVIEVELSEDEEKALNIALNNAEISGQWNTPKLAEILTGLKGSELLTATGFDEHQVAQFLDRVRASNVQPVYPLAPKLLESYDYVVIMAKHETDWMNLRSFFRLETESSYKKQKIGLGRVVSFERFMELLTERGVFVEPPEPEPVSKEG
jgi:hypothetical protein